MSTHLGQELAALVEPVGHDTGPDTAELWRLGRRRRRWAVVRTTCVAAIVAALVALVVWPGTWQGSAVPADASPSRQRTYPSVVPQQHFPGSMLTAHRPMTAAYVSGQSLYAVDDRGRLWRAPQAPGERWRAAVSADGRFVSDGWDVYDTVTGARARLGTGDGVGAVRRSGVDWAPDSAHVAVVQDDAGVQTAWVGTPQGDLQRAPALPAGESSAPVDLMLAWLDSSRLLVVMPAPQRADDSETTHLMAFAWTVASSGTWDLLGTLTLPKGVALDYLGTSQVSVSPDGGVLAVTTTNSLGSSALTWPMPTLGSETTNAHTVEGATDLSVDGLSWRGDDLVVSRGGETRVARTGELLSTIGTGSGRPVSWRAGAFDDAPYYNSAAVWQDRLFGWALLLGILTAITVLIRAARPLAARAGLLGQRYAGPFPLEARWMYSQNLR